MSSEQSLGVRMALVPKYYDVPLGTLISKLIQEPHDSRDSHLMVREINERFVLMDEARKDQVTHDFYEYEQAKRG